MDKWKGWFPPLPPIPYPLPPAPSPLPLIPWFEPLYNQFMLEKSIEFQIGEILRQKSLLLAVAESCTGGLLSHRITNVPGSSDYFVAGITPYANQAKISLLGVRNETLEKYGAVSEETVIEMARGIRLSLSVNIAVSVSGIAGPGGGTPEKPVGTTWIGISTANFEKAWCNFCEGTRAEIKEQTAQQALELLLDQLKKYDEYHHNSIEPLEVSARFDYQGDIKPLHFSWKDKTYPIVSTGRSWQDETGHHFLVMVPDDRIFEIIFAGSDSCWYIKLPTAGRGTI
ncbi:MAG: CinA family protein [Chloroflexota bacterium]|nr:CinA family protein [Chloroflexota bacterium]